MSSDETTIQPVRKSRRDLLKTAGVVAGAAVAAKLVASDAASAADGQPILVGNNNSGSFITTGLTTAGTDAAPGLQAFKVVAPNFDNGITGEAKDYGVVGTGAGGVLGLGTVGGVLSGNVCAINLDPQGTVGAPTGEAFKGDMAVDSAGVLWLCVADGTPGTWIKVSHGGVRALAAPFRTYFNPTPVNQGENRVIPVAGVTPGVPSNAIGVLGNLTVYDFLGGGFCTLYPTGAALPTTSSINWNGPSPVPGAAIANAFSVGLGTGGAVTIYANATVAAGSPATKVLLDITAYIL